MGVAGLVLLVAMLQAWPPSAPPARPSVVAAPDAVSDAYYAFLLGRHLESEGNPDGALRAYQQAIEADPKSAELHAELAGLYARQNKPDDALAAGEAAVALDPANAEANYVLGTIHASRAQREESGVSAASALASIDKAIGYLERARPQRQYDFGLHLTLGRLYLARSRFNEAVDVLAWLLEREPGIAEAHWLIAQAYEGLGNRTKAVLALQDTVTLEPRFYRAWVRLGELAEGDRRWSDAADAFEQAAVQNPRDAGLRLRQAQALLNDDKPAAARELMRKVIEASPAEPAALYLLSVAERRAGDLRAAETAARKLLEIAPADARGAFALADVYAAQYDHRQVIEALRPAIERATAERGTTDVASRLLLRTGLAWQELGEYDKAFRAFEDARRLGAGADADPYVAQVYIARGDVDRALASIESARKNGGDEVMLARLQAQALQKGERHADAVAALRAAVTAHQDRFELHAALADALARAKQVDEALSVLDRAAERFRGETDVTFRRGAILEQAGRYAEAERAFREVVQKEPQNASALNYLGYMLADRGERLEEATTFIERALADDPHNPSFLDSLGWVWFKRGEMEKARQPLMAAAERLPRNSVVQDHLGDFFEALGDRAGAVAAWKRALAGDGESIDRGAVAAKIARLSGK